MENIRADLAGKKVVVGMTGRMDSALAAFLLKKQGMNVIGLAMALSDSELVKQDAYLPKCHIPDLEAVKRLCEFLDIPFFATNAKAQFESEVLDPLVCNKLLGQANRSCMDCSKTRMVALYDKMLALKADFMATGHYAKCRMNVTSKEYYICSNANEASDQSFLLAGTPSHIMKRLLLPLGELSKKEVVKYAKHFGLPAAPSKEQAGFCFRSKEASLRILEKTIPKSLIRPGPVENVENGNSLGEHEGIIYHHMAEKDLSFKGSSHVDKNLEIVGYDYSSAVLKVGEAKRLAFRGAQLSRLALIEGVDRTAPIKCFVKFKYSNNFVASDLFFKNNNSGYLHFEQEVYPLIKGEALVLYDANHSNAKVVGWGLVAQRGEFKLLNRVQAFESKNAGDAEEDEKSTKDKPDYGRF